MNKMIALAIMQALLSAGAPKSELTLECHQIGLKFTDGKKVRTVQVEACQLYVTKDRLCQAVYDYKQGFVLRCEPSTKSIHTETL